MKLRTIKFRVWDKHKKYMHKLDALFLDEKMFRVQNYKNEHDVFSFGTEYFSEPMQFTGLLDKNMVEIYEGDVVTIKGDERKFYIRWFDDMCFAFADVRSDYVKTFYSCYDTSNGFPLDEWIEVIGNIYKHPHLLEANHD